MLNFQLFVIIIASLLIFSFGTGSSPIAGVDEGRFTQASFNMIKSGDWIVPRLDGEWRLEKPVLFYWEQAVSFLFFGLTEFAARLPSVLSATGLVALSYFMGFLQGTPLLAALICMSTLIINLFAKVAIVDMGLCLFISSALSFFFLSYFYKTKTNHIFNRQSIGTKIYFYLSALSMSLGFLSKGPIAVLLPAIIIILFLITEKEVISFFSQRRYDLLICFGIFTCINLPWYSLIHAKTSGLFTYNFFFGDNINRFFNTLNNHRGPFFYYLPIILIGFFPWSFFFIQALLNDQNPSKVSRINITDNTNTLKSFNLIWITVSIIFFSLAQTKLPTYILPIALPFTLTVAKYWSVKINTAKISQAKNYDVLLGLLCILICFPIALVLILDKLSNTLASSITGDIQFLVIVLGIIFSSVLLIAMTSVRSNLKLSFILISTCSIGLYLFSMNLIVKPVITELDGGIKQFCKENYKSKAALFTYKLQRASLGFYCKTPVKNINELAELNQFTTHKRAYLVMKKELYSKNRLSFPFNSYKLLKESNKYSFLTTL